MIYVFAYLYIYLTNKFKPSMLLMNRNLIMRCKNSKPNHTERQIWQKKHVTSLEPHSQKCIASQLIIFDIYFFFYWFFKKQIITWIKTINWGGGGGRKKERKKKKAAAYVNRQIGLAPGHSESAESVRAKIQGTSEEAHHRQPHEQADRTADQSLPKMPRPKADSILV